MEPRILILGSSGMAGHLLSRYLTEKTKSEIIDVGPRRKIGPKTRLCDLENIDCLKSLISETKPNVIVNCTGMLVQASELHKKQAVWVNSFMPHFLSEYCTLSDIRFIHLSTDCVFSGQTGPYRENDHRDGDAFYDRSKALGEIVDGSALTIRTSIIGPELRPDGTGLFNWVMNQYGKIRGYRKTLWSGVTTLELAKAICFFIETNTSLSGLVHYSVPGKISKFELLGEISRVFDKGLEIIPIDEPIMDKRLVSTRMDLKISPVDYATQLLELKKWIYSHPELYPHYLEKV
jgi:dTDP-4-dehydrorhamnose reductase